MCIRDSFLAKLRICNNEEDGEGIWFYYHPDDKFDLQNDTDDRDTSRVRLGVLANTSLHGIPVGMIIPYQLYGDLRPHLDITTLDINGVELQPSSWRLNTIIPHEAEHNEKSN